MGKTKTDVGAQSLDSAAAMGDRMHSGGKGISASEIVPHGILQGRSVTGNKNLRKLKAKALALGIPEDLYYLMKKAVAIRNTEDKDTKFRLKHVESRIKHLALWYKKIKQLPPDWEYKRLPLLKKDNT